MGYCSLFFSLEQMCAAGVSTVLGQINKQCPRRNGEGTG